MELARAFFCDVIYGKTTPKSVLWHEQEAAKMATKLTSATQWTKRALRGMLGVALAACGVIVMLNHDYLRTLETILAASLSNSVTPGDMYVAPGGHSFFWAASTPAMHGLRVTAECTSAFLLGPLLILAGLILASGRFGLVRALSATAVAGAILVLANQGRIVLIAWATAKWGVENGYQWSHTVGGSIVVGIGVALALVAFMIMLSARRKRRPTRRATFQAPRTPHTPQAV